MIDRPSTITDYNELPCKCGFTMENNFDEYEIYQMKMGKIYGTELPNRPTWRCKTCKTISILQKNHK